MTLSKVLTCVLKIGFGISAGANNRAKSLNYEGTGWDGRPCSVEVFQREGEYPHKIRISLSSEFQSGLNEEPKSYSTEDFEFENTPDLDLFNESGDFMQLENRQSGALHISRSFTLRRCKSCRKSSEVFPEIHSVFGSISVEGYDVSEQHYYTCVGLVQTNR
jgi:hypothetical protein